MEVLRIFTDSAMTNQNKADKLRISIKKVETEIVETKCNISTISLAKITLENENPGFPDNFPAEIQFKMDKLDSERELLNSHLEALFAKANQLYHQQWNIRNTYNLFDKLVENTLTKN